MILLPNWNFFHRQQDINKIIKFDVWSISKNSFDERFMVDADFS